MSVLTVQMTVLDAEFVDLSVWKVNGKECEVERVKLTELSV